MLKIYFLYKTTNRVNNRTFYGVYASQDIYFGTEFAIDRYCGGNRELQRDVEQYGAHNFTVEGIHGFATEEEAYKALERYKPLATYKHGNSREFSEEHKRNIGAAVSGANNGMAIHGHTEAAKRAIAEHRKSMRWIHRGDEERQIPKDDPLLDGWTYGRSASLREKVRQSQAKKTLTNQGVAKS